MRIDISTFILGQTFSQRKLYIFLKIYFIIIIMNYKRTDLQTKKDYYKRIALIKKTNYINQHKSWEDTYLESHFLFYQKANQAEQWGIKNYIKSETKTGQKLRNRIAAQESRQRHQSYVKELQQKVKMYEQLLEKEGALCKNCKKIFLSQTNMQCETNTAQEFSDHSSSLHMFNCIESEDQIINSYLNEQIVRIDNKDANTPFGIFFIICLIGVVAVFGLSSNSGDITPRLLANYQSTVNQLIQMQEKMFQNKFLPDSISKQIDIQTIQSNEDWQGFKDQNLLEPFMSVNLDASSKSSRNWTKHGDYICSQPSLIMKQQQIKPNRGPEFLLLKTGKNRAKALKTLNVTTDQKLGHRINIQSNQWQDVEISSCFRQNL